MLKLLLTDKVFKALLKLQVLLLELNCIKLKLLADANRFHDARFELFVYDVANLVCQKAVPLDVDV